MARTAASGSPEVAAVSAKGARKQRTASREMRSASPVKVAQPTSSRAKASPKKRSRKANGVKAADEAKSASKNLQDLLDVDGSPSVADSEDEAGAIIEAAVAPEEALEDVADTIAVVNGAADVDDELKPNTARVTVTSDVVDEGDAETTRTSVKVELPVGSPEQPLPENPEEAIAQAKELVAAAKQLSPSDGASKSRKRKADDMEIENPEEEVVEEIVKNEETIMNGGVITNGEVEFGARTEEPPAKRARVMVPAEEFRRKKMQTRALVGLSATVAVG